VIKSLALLFAGTFAFWLATALPARILWGDTAVVYSTVAGLLCFLPMAATFIWSERALHGTMEAQLAAVLGGTGLRMVFVAGAGIALYLLFPYFREQSFMFWVIAYYLVTLTLEMGLLLARRSATDASRNS
jgi:hypothetical protein